MNLILNKDSIIIKENIKPKWYHKAIRFVVDTVKTAKTKVIDFFKGFYNNFESITILTLSSFGISALIGELPFLLTLPMWIEAAMVIPFISVCIVWLLATSGEKRAKRRLAYA
jgi:hypothetical protein